MDFMSGDLLFILLLQQYINDLLLNVDHLIQGLSLIISMCLIALSIKPNLSCLLISNNYKQFVINTETKESNNALLVQQDGKTLKKNIHINEAEQIKWGTFLHFLFIFGNRK